MKTLKGLYTDIHPVDQPEGTYPFAKNVINSHTLNALENEKGFVKFNAVVPGDKILGIIPIGKRFLIMSCGLITGVGHIGTITIDGLNLLYDDVYSSVDLAFNPDAGIKGEYQINAKNQTIVAWVEIGGTNPPRVINIDNPDITTIDDLALFPKFIGGNVSATVLDSGGSLLTASYLPIYKYKKTDLSETDWIVSPSPVAIVNELSTDPVQRIDGAPAGTPTTKAIRVTFSSMDTRYDKIVVGYIRLKNGVSEAFRLSEINNGMSASYIITGNETSTDVSLDEVTTPSANYNNAQAITQLNNQLLLGNLTSSDVLDLQGIANQIIIDYTVEDSRFATNAALKAGDLPGSFQSGDVYALYLVVELLGGGLLAYHIPGRGPSASEIVSDSTSIAGVTAKKFQVSDTSVPVGRVNKMSYWENTSEVYPSNFPDGLSDSGGIVNLANQPVRHHKFPDLTTILSRHYPAFDGNTMNGLTMPRLGLSASNVNIPADIKPFISGWKIAYAKRSYQNSLVIAPDLLHLGARGTSNTGPIWSTGGNWHIKAIQGNSDTDWEDMMLWRHNSDPVIEKVHRGHSPDLLFDKPGVIPSYVEFAFKLKSENLNTLYTAHGAVGGTLAVSGRDAGQAPGGVIDFSKPTSKRTPIPGVRKLKVSNFQYIPQNTQVGNISTKLSEEIVYMEIDNLKTTLENHGTNGILDYPVVVAGVPRVTVLNTRSSGADASDLFNDDVNGDYESTYYTIYKQILSDMYVSYKNQTLILTNKRANPNTTSLTNIYGGDIHQSIVSYMTTSVQTPELQDDGNANIHGPRMFKYYLAETRHNWNFRHEETTAVEDWYAPKTDPRDFWTPRAGSGGNLTSLIDTLAMRLNKLSYNTDYDMINEYVPALIVDDIESFSTSSPTTIIYSAVQGLDSNETAWSSFSANARHTQPKNRGPITNLQGYRNKDLIIHHRDSLFITRSNISLTTDTDNVQLNSASLFDLPPEEVLSTDQGYAGTRHPLACKLTKLGYTFPSDKQGKIFTYDGKLKEISALGMRDFFRQYGEGASSLVDGEDIVTVDLLPQPSFGSSQSPLWSQTATVFPSVMIDWTIDSAGAHIALEGALGTGNASTIVYRPITVIPGSSLNVALTFNILSGFTGLLTFYYVFFDASNNPISQVGMAAYNNPGILMNQTVFKSAIVPENAAKVGFRISTSPTVGPSYLDVTNFKVTGDQVYTTQIEADLAPRGYALEYDEENNRLLVAKASDDTPWTLSYNPANELWASFHSYHPDWLFGTQNKLLLSAKGTDLYLHNAGPYGVYYEETPEPMIIDTIFNPEPTVDKILSNLHWTTIIQNGHTPLWDQTFDYVTVSSPYRCTGRTPINRLTGPTRFQGANVKVYNDKWYFNSIYDVVNAPDFRKDWTEDFEIDATKLNSNPAWYQKRKFIDKYVTCRLEYTNTTNYKLLLIDQGADFRPSAR